MSGGQGIEVTSIQGQMCDPPHRYVNKIEEIFRKIFSFWSQLFTGLALNSFHIQMNSETILRGAINYHIISLDIRLTPAGHWNLAGLSDRFIRSGPRAPISRQDWPIVLIDRCPRWNLAEIYGIDVADVVCGMCGLITRNIE